MISEATTLRLKRDLITLRIVPRLWSSGHSSTKLSTLEALKGLILKVPGAITLSLFTTVDSQEEGAEFEVTGFDKAFDLPTLGITILDEFINDLNNWYQSHVALDLGFTRVSSNKGLGFWKAVSKPDYRQRCTSTIKALFVLSLVLILRFLVTRFKRISDVRLLRFLFQALSERGYGQNLRILVAVYNKEEDKESFGGFFLSKGIETKLKFAWQTYGLIGLTYSMIDACMISAASLLNVANIVDTAS
ncbi:hypothetical protein Tco_1386586 [Tanacetum coccineum]